MKDDPEYPTPQEFVRSTHGFEEQPTASMLGTVGGMASSLGAHGMPNVNMSLLQSLTRPAGNGSQFQGIVAPPTQTPIEELPANWGRCLEIILDSAVNTVEEDAQGFFKLAITETEAGKDVYFIQLTSTKKSVTTDNPTGRDPDVFVSISSPDLAQVLDGSLAPLQAYLTGRISASGDVRKLMFFDKLSKRGHKPGSMFSV